LLSGSFVYNCRVLLFKPALWQSRIPMPTIEFAHLYDKLRVLGTSRIATLLEVLPVRLEELSETFLKYDTTYSNGQYELPKSGEYLLLIFRAPAGIFTTLRTPEQREYYKSHIGAEFDLDVAT
jgi:hypothetical protein